MHDAAGPDPPVMYIALDSERKKKNRIAQRKSRQKKQQANHTHQPESPAASSHDATSAATPTTFEAGLSLGPSVTGNEAWFGADSGDLVAVLAAAQAAPPPSNSGRSSSLLSRRDDGSISDYSAASFAPDDFTPRTSVSSLSHDFELPLNPTNLAALYSHPTSVATTPSSGALQEPTLHRAVRKKNYDIVHLLLRHGASVNALCGRGQTALHLAIRQGDLKIVRLLLDHQVDIALRDDDGLTALELAIELSSVETVRLLLAYGTRMEE